MNINSVSSTNFGNKAQISVAKTVKNKANLYNKGKQTLIENIVNNISELEIERNMLIVSHSHKSINETYFKKLYNIDKTIENLRNNLAILHKLK